MKGRLSRCRLAMLLLLVALQVLLASCSSWQQTQARAEPVAGQKPLKQVRAHLVDGSVVTLRGPWFAGDTLFGYREAHQLDTKPVLYGRPEAQPRDSVAQHLESDSTAIPISQIAKLEAWQFSALKTLGCVLGVGLALVGVGAVIAVSGGAYSN